MRTASGSNPPAMGIIGGGRGVTSARPTTAQQGLSGKRTGTGSGRTVQDGSYFAGLIRSKISEITQEIGNMRVETERTARDSSLVIQLERRYEAAVKEVRSLEGDLADYNLAMDKSRTNVEISEIQSHLAVIKRRNEAMSKDVRTVTQRARHERVYALPCNI